MFEFDTGGEDAEFGLGEVEPRAMLWGVVPFEALDEPSGFGGREGLVERRLAVDVEVVLDEHDGLGLREVAIGQILQDMRIVDGGVALAGKPMLDFIQCFQQKFPDRH